jgi:vacuolar-type H+-ATPase subunit E/Vma4
MESRHIQIAEKMLKAYLAEIEAEYQMNKTKCKISINYEMRMASLNNIEWDMTSYYSDLLCNFVMTQMHPDENNFADILDLRTMQ